MRHIAVIAPHSSNPITMEINKGKFENSNVLDAVELSPIDGRFEVRKKGHGILYVMPT